MKVSILWQKELINNNYDTENDKYHKCNGKIIISCIMYMKIDFQSGPEIIDMMY